MDPYSHKPCDAVIETLTIEPLKQPILDSKRQTLLKEPYSNEI